jgi:hypothetical protein
MQEWRYCLQICRQIKISYLFALWLQPRSSRSDHKLLFLREGRRETDTQRRESREVMPPPPLPNQNEGTTRTPKGCYGRRRRRRRHKSRRAAPPPPLLTPQTSQSSKSHYAIRKNERTERGIVAQSVSPSVCFNGGNGGSSVSYSSIAHNAQSEREDSYVLIPREKEGR